MKFSTMLIQLEAFFNLEFHKDNPESPLGYDYHMYIYWDYSTGLWAIDWGRWPFADKQRTGRVFERLAELKNCRIHKNRVYSVFESAKEALITFLTLAAV